MRLAHCHVLEPHFVAAQERAWAPGMAVPALRAESQAVADLEAVSGDLVALEPAWTVPMPV